jgi:hypothetical protein
MGTVDRRLLGHWEAARWRSHERAPDEQLERVVVDARLYLERRRATVAAARKGPTPPAPAI